MTAEPEGLEVVVDIDVEHEWRCTQLQLIGFSDFQSFRLSISGADWHVARKMLEDGASHETVLDILI